MVQVEKLAYAEYIAAVEERKSKPDGRYGFTDLITGLNGAVRTVHIHAHQSIIKGQGQLNEKGKKGNRKKAKAGCGCEHISDVIVDVGDVYTARFVSGHQVEMGQRNGHHPAVPNEQPRSRNMPTIRVDLDSVIQLARNGWEMLKEWINSGGA
jgi:hypothetical protein